MDCIQSRLFAPSSTRWRVVLVATAAFVAACGSDSAESTGSGAGGGGPGGGEVTGASGSGGGGGSTPPAVPRAVEVARTTTIPSCTVFVDAANRGQADGTAA